MRQEELPKAVRATRWNASREARPVAAPPALRRDDGLAGVPADHGETEPGLGLPEHRPAVTWGVREHEGRVAGVDVLAVHRSREEPRLPDVRGPERAAGGREEAHDGH